MMLVQHLNTYDDDDELLASFEHNKQRPLVFNGERLSLLEQLPVRNKVVNFCSESDFFIRC
jgi:hypothetical protein